MTQDMRILNHPAYVSENALFNAIMFRKMEDLDSKIDYLLEKDKEKELSEFNSVEWKKEEIRRFSPKGDSVADSAGAKRQQEQQACNEIIARANIMLGEWEKVSELRTQIQYATIVIKKIENLKKVGFIAENEAGKKICTLLRNTIKLNSGEEMFTPEQIGLIKKGLEKAASADSTKEDMLRLNRELCKSGLRTMPAWE